MKLFIADCYIARSWHRLLDSWLGAVLPDERSGWHLFLSWHLQVSRPFLPSNFDFVNKAKGYHHCFLGARFDTGAELMPSPARLGRDAAIIYHNPAQVAEVPKGGMQIRTMSITTFLALIN